MGNIVCCAKAVLKGSVKKTSSEMEEDILDELVLSEMFQVASEVLENAIMKGSVKMMSSEMEEDFLEEFLLSELFQIPEEDVECDPTKDGMDYKEFDFMSGATCGSDVGYLVDVEELENFYIDDEIKEDTDTFGGPSSPGAVNSTPSPDFEESALQRSEGSSKKLSKPYPRVD
ncbi:uncharacterized protein RHO17_026528 [Thomomys bottae]